MKTKDLIEQLQKADPSGEMHVVLPSGCIPSFVMSEPGYWDGSYSYLLYDGDEDNNKWVHSIKGAKNKIVGIETYDFIEEHQKLSWEEFKEKIIFEFDGYHPDNKQEKIDYYLNRWKQDYDEWHSWH